MKIDITPNTPEPDLRKLITKSYWTQSWVCLLAAGMAGLAYTMLSLDISILSMVSAGFSVLAMYFSYRVFHFSAQMRASLRELIKMQRILK